MRLLNKLLIGLLFLSFPVYAGYTNIQRVMFEAGHTAPYNDEYVQRVIVGQAKIMPNGSIVNLPHPSHIQSTLIFPEFKIIEEEPASLATWTVFFLVQAADIWSTKKALAYDCVYELNPLLPRVPEVHEMVLLKTAIFGSILPEIQKRQTITNEILMPTLMLTSVVVHSNLRVLEKAKKHCNKR